ncbi:hypothetical protein [Ruminococcus sp.]|uniref:TadE/TadG family type IV pilus assembly protein n=1 Tax=Ruminococcus sp. TaxID=41978 RepID=UPI0025D3591E|nr:hypothetical protein [Ruminococcus sp.]MBR1432584.1 hypothetical protein [Ruminococcus sp.]
MKELFKDERGNSSVVEAAIIYPVVFVCVLFLIMSGFTYAQKALLQANADRLSTYIANCISFPGYDELVDPFYEPAKSTAMTTRISSAMLRSEPYRYVAGLFGLNSDVKRVASESQKGMVNGFLNNISYLKPSSNDVPIPAEMSKLSPSKNNGYICAISADTASITVYLGQSYIFANYFRFIGLNGKKQLIYGKSTANVSDNVELIRIVDFAFDTIEEVSNKLGIDVDKIKNFINKIKE